MNSETRPVQPRVPNLTIYGGHISNCRIGISMSPNVVVETRDVVITETGIAYQIQGEISPELASAVIADIQNGASISEVRAKHDQALKASGSSLDAWLARAGDLAGVAALFAQVATINFPG